MTGSGAPLEGQGSLSSHQPFPPSWFPGQMQKATPWRCEPATSPWVEFTPLHSNLTIEFKPQTDPGHWAKLGKAKQRRGVTQALTPAGTPVQALTSHPDPQLVLPAGKARLGQGSLTTVVSDMRLPALARLISAA